MKPILISLSLLLLASIMAKGQCLDIPSFRNACNTVVTDCGGCTTWADGCGSGWVRSNGTPQLIPYTYELSGKTIHSFYAYMWAAGGNGEGMFTNLSSGNTFLAHHAYDFTIRLQTTGGTGTVNVVAVNGLSQSVLSSPLCCGSSVPNISPRQTIGTYTITNNQWLDVPLSFIANANYSQLWIYPTSSTNTQFNLYVMYVGACLSCNALLVYNSGNIPIANSEAGTILTGSSAGTGGSGTVGIQAAATTSLLATNEIDWLPDFQAIVTTGSFSSIVNPCGFGNNGRFTPDSLTLAQIDSIDIPLPPPPNESGGSSVEKRAETRLGEVSDIIDGNINHDINVYPSVSAGRVNIVANKGDLNNADITVFDQLGQQVFYKKNTKESSVTIQLQSLRDGLYYVQIKNQKRTLIKKIIISKQIL